MDIRLSDHFTYKRLLRFTFPSIVMMIFTSIYGVVDGIFVSNFAGKTSFAAINLIMPFLMVFSALGFMFGTGGSALVAKTMGEGNRVRANRLFSMLIVAVMIGGVAFSVLGFFILRPVAQMLGAEGQMLTDCVTYGRILLLGLTPFMLQNAFQSFLITAERAKLGLWITVAAGVTNIVLDALLVAVFSFGLVGAAIATVISQVVGGVVPLIYFAFPNKSLLHFTTPLFDARALLKTCTNGSSELLTNFSLSFVNMLYNFRLMEIAGEDGVAAYGVILYTNFIFISVFIGYAIGSAPIISYHYGAGNKTELGGLLRKSLVILGVMSVLMTAAGEAFSYPLSYVFVGYDGGLLEMTVLGFRLYTLSFLILGINIFASSFFTALNNGVVSAILSFLRTLVLPTVFIFVLPIFWEIVGVWLGIVVAELLSLATSAVFWLALAGRYGYGKKASR